jgi:hypothetical protein
MKREKSADQYEQKEIELRLQRTLKAAFNMKPTPLKEIPKRNGGKRAGASKASPRRVIQSKSKGS